MPLSPFAPMPLYFLAGGCGGIPCAGDRPVTPAQLQRN